ncbi:MAG: glycosyl hydrolase family protein, partial [Acetobacteraceae bacterium]
MDEKHESQSGSRLSMLAGYKPSLGMAWAAVKRGLIIHVRAWTKADWFAGIKPLPRDMTSQMAAIGIVVGLLLGSLVYGENYLDRLWRGRLIASDELDQRTAHLVPKPEPEQQPAPVPPKVEAEPPPPPKPRLSQMGESFIERFDAPALSDHWYISDGWDNGPHMDNDWRKSQLDLTPGNLTLTLEKAPDGHPKPMVSAEVRTLPFYRYGYFEARVKVPKGAGLVTGIFTYAHLDGATRSNEIDIEILGKDTRTLEATIHQNGKSSLKRVRLPFDAAEGFHTLGF